MKLEIKNLSKNYGDVKALNNVSFSLENGIYGMLGPNGAGKSTLINLLTDNLKRSSGEILWEGTEIRSLGAGYRNILGYMPQQQGYYEEYTAKAFLIYIGRLKGMNRKDAEKRADELLEVVNLRDHARERIGGFSGGMRQRLLLIQALMNDPELLILDEPTAGVDPQERIRIRNFISEIAADRIVVLATHIVSDVESIAGEILLMKRGEIIRSGVPFELLEEIKSKIFEIEVPLHELHDIQERYIISNLRNTADGLALKVVSERPPEEYKYTNVSPNLEDVYLYYFEHR